MALRERYSHTGIVEVRANVTYKTRMLQQKLEVALQTHAVCRPQTTLLAAACIEHRC